MRISRALPFALLAVGIILIPRLAWWERGSVELKLGVAGPPNGSGKLSPPKGLGWMLGHLKARPVGRKGWDLLPGELGPAELRGLSAVYLTGGLHGPMDPPVEFGSEEESASAAGFGRGDLLKAHLKTWLRASDARALSDFTARGGTAVGEGGLLAAVGDTEARWRMEDCFRVRWTGWIGLSVDDIGDPSQAPGWVLKWLRGAGDMTTVSGPAVILMTDDQILVLRTGIELDEKVHEIAWLNSAEPAYAEGLPSVVPYRGWFEVVKARGGCEVISEHRLHVTEWGEQKLASAGLSKTFPCFVKYRGAYAGYYVAASISQGGPNAFWVQVAGYPSLASLISSKLGSERGQMYWDFYYPLMRRVILEAATPWEDT